MNYNLVKQNCDVINSWEIEGLIYNKNRLRVAKNECKKHINKKPILNNFCTQK